MQDIYFVGITDEGILITAYTNFKTLIQMLQDKNWTEVYVTTSYDEWADKLPEWRCKVI